ncbi:MAG UNVERIFIED_CONTAM: hypothetical protein LVT10_13225 [Anaerolineae bacterium]
MNSSKANILARLRQHPAPFAHLPAPQTRRVMHPLDDSTDLVGLFCAQAQKLSAQVSLPTSPAQAIELILQLIGEDRSVLTWDFPHIPLHGLEDALQQAHIERAPDRSDGVRVGISGVDAALASTGSIVVSAREGRSRAGLVVARPTHCRVNNWANPASFGCVVGAPANRSGRLPRGGQSHHHHRCQSYRRYWHGIGFGRTRTRPTYRWSSYRDVCPSPIKRGRFGCGTAQCELY